MDEVTYTKRQCWFKSTLKFQCNRFLSIYRSKNDLKLCIKALNTQLALFEKLFLDLVKCSQLVSILRNKKHLVEVDKNDDLSDVVFYTQVFHVFCTLLCCGYSFKSFGKIRQFIKLMWDLDMETSKCCRTIKLKLNANDSNSLEFLT